MEDARPDHEPADKARIQAMNAVQWLARLAHSYAAGGENVELRWDRRSGRIVTPEIAPGVAVGISLPTLVLQFEEDGELSQHPIDIDDKSSSEVEAWILIELLHRGIDRDRFSKALPYQPKGLMSGEEPKYAPQDLADELQQLANSFEAAADVLARVRDSLVRTPAGAEEDAASSDLVFGPEHMEVGFSTPTFGDDPADGLVEIGFSGGDSEDRRPRYFVRRETSKAASDEPLLLLLEDVASMSPSEVTDAVLDNLKRVKASAAS